MRLNAALIFFATLFFFWSGRNLPAEAKSEEIVDTYSLAVTKPIYQLTVSGTVNLQKENSFFRIILVDQNKNEYLVYETSPLLTNQNSFSFANACEETCTLEAVIPKSLRVEGYAVSYEITKTSFIDDFQKLDKKTKAMGLAPAREALKEEKDNLKIQKLNERIKAKGLKWIAGETSVSQLSYAEKKKLFTKPDGTPVDRLPNLQGFEYYKGGIFEIKSENKDSSLVKGTTSSNLPASWDWRNVHGENWITSVKNQGPHGTCGYFAITAVLETLINLYKNEHLNYDLSEQNLIDCYEQLPQCLNDVACLLSTKKIFEEFCQLYMGERQSTCLDQCIGSVNYQFSDISHYIWPLDTYNSYINNPDPYVAPIRNRMLYPSFENIKRELILKGPLDYGLGSIYHATLLVGYKDNGQNLITTFKNSWGEDWGENGYGQEELRPENLLYWSRGPLFVSLKGINPFNPNEAKCVDKDNDGYCNWGISENKPDTCPAFCKPKKDCDDSNANLGPFDENLNCVALSPTTFGYDLQITSFYACYTSATTTPEDFTRGNYRFTIGVRNNGAVASPASPTGVVLFVNEYVGNFGHPTVYTFGLGSINPNSSINVQGTKTMVTWGFDYVTTDINDDNPANNELHFIKDSGLCPTTPTPTPTCPGLNGDANQDGTVNLGDFITWSSHFLGTIPTVGSGDLNCNGQVNLGDFEIWRENVI